MWICYFFNPNITAYLPLKFGFAVILFLTSLLVYVL
uniref:Uncharacterized protein n=1 Tax=Anguilla anguilla TaxID=7936 RepID=A0A0E9TLJ9_ANGAN